MTEQPVPVEPPFTKTGYVDSMKTMHDYLAGNVAHWQSQHDQLLGQAADALKKVEANNAALQAVNAVLALEA